MVTIEYYKEENFEALYALMPQWGAEFDKQLFIESLNGILNEYGNEIVLALHNGELAGYAQIKPTYHLGFMPFVEIIELLVSEKFRTTGIGGMLIQKAEEVALSKNIYQIKLNSRVQLEKAHEFYQHLGYKQYKTSKFFEKKLMP